MINSPFNSDKKCMFLLRDFRARAPKKCGKRNCTRIRHNHEDRRPHSYFPCNDCNDNNHINPPRKDVVSARTRTRPTVYYRIRASWTLVYIIKPSSPSAYAVSLRLRTSLKLHAESFFFLESLALVSLQSSWFHLRALAA